MKQNHEIKIKILQNGHPIAECDKTLKRNLNISITSNYTGDLSIPLYPLVSNINLFKEKKGILYLNIEQPWSGLVTSKGDPLHLDEKKRSSKQIPLRLNDYGSIYLRDLRVLFRIVAKKKKSKTTTKKIKGYKSKISDNFFANHLEAKGFSVAFFIACICLASFIFILFNFHKDKPKEFSSLSKTYTIPFINYGHLKLAPEALQNNIDRQNMIKSTIDYYNALTEVLIGWDEVEQSELVHKSTIDRYKKIYDLYHDQIQKAYKNQEQKNKKQLSDEAKGTMFIPSVAGSSFTQKLLGLNNRLENIHLALQTRYENRRRIAEIFPKDEPYDWTNYQQINNNKRTFANEILSKIRVFDGLTNEEHMYAVANNLAAEAQEIQDILFNKEEYLTDTNVIKEIKISNEISYASFINSSEALIRDSKIGKINASKFNTVHKQIIKEPLIGKIDPSLIQNTVKEKQFELQICYNLALRRNHRTQGEMSWQWRIDTRGHISDLTLKTSTINDSKMIDCIRRKMAQWKFPRPKRGSVEVTHSFQFSPQFSRKFSRQFSTDENEDSL
ncbi:MAG: AgmX/PglI C-terminal domain-containing protein [Bdellovibrionota bacterium]